MHWIAKVTLWVSIAFTAVLSFQVFVSVDEAQPVGTTTTFTVDEVDTPSKDEAIAAIEDAARDTGANIYKVQADPRNSTTGRILFAFIGDEAAFEASGGFDYPTFSSQTLATRVVLASEITTEDMRGEYVTSADQDQLTAIITGLTEAGIAASDSTVPEVQVFLYAVAQGNFGASLGVVVVALTVALAYSVSSNRKVHAIKTLHGYGWARILRAELSSAAATFGIGVAALLIIGVPVLGLYNGFQQASRFGVVLAAGLAGLGLYAAAFNVVLGGAATLRDRIPEVIKGERAPIRDGLLAAGAQLVVLGMVLGTVSGAMARIEAVDRTTDELSLWSEMDSAYALRLTSSITHQDMMRDAPELATVIAQMDEDGQVLMAGYKAGTGTDSAPYSPEGSKSMIVNMKYLEVQPVLDEDGKAIESVPSGTDVFTLLVPISYDGDLDALLEEYTAYFSSYCQEWGDESDSPCDPQGTIVRTASGQDLFTFNGTEFIPAEMQQTSSLRDPVLAVVSPSSGLINSMEYLSYTSLDDILFFDADVLDEKLTEQGIRGSFQGIDNAADAVTYSVSLSQREQRMDVFGLVLGGLVLVLATLMFAAVYCDRRRRPLFVEHVHGYSFAHRHRALIAGNLAASIATAAMTMGLGHMTRGRDLLAAAVLVAIVTVVTTVAVKVYESSFHADFIKRS